MNRVLLVPVVMTLGVGAGAAVEEQAGRAGRPMLSVEFRPRVVMSGEDVIVVVHITPDRASRSLLVTIESPEYYASTERQLHGEASPSLHQFTWRALPAGRHLVTVELRDALGTVQMADRILEVFGPDQNNCSTDSGVIGSPCAPADRRRSVVKDRRRSAES